MLLGIWLGALFLGHSEPDGQKHSKSTLRALFCPGRGPLGTPVNGSRDRTPCYMRFSHAMDGEMKMLRGAASTWRFSLCCKGKKKDITAVEDRGSLISVPFALRPGLQVHSGGIIGRALCLKTTTGTVFDTGAARLRSFSTGSSDDKPSLLFTSWWSTLRLLGARWSIERRIFLCVLSPALNLSKTFLRFSLCRPQYWEENNTKTHEEQPEKCSMATGGN